VTDHYTRPRQAHAIRIERASPDQAATLAALHVNVWRETYRDLATPEALEILDANRLRPYREATLTHEDPAIGAHVAVCKGEVLGVASYGPPGSALAPLWEIKHLYVASHARGLGLGARLLRAAQAHLQTHGQASTGLAVVVQNTSARAFYRAMGGIEGTQFTDPGPLWKSDNVVVAWVRS